MDDVNDFIASVEAEYQDKVRSGEMGTILFTQAEYETLIHSYIEQAFIDGRPVLHPGFKDEVAAFVSMCEKARLYETHISIVLKGVARPRIEEDGTAVLLWPFSLEIIG